MRPARDDAPQSPTRPAAGHCGRTPIMPGLPEKIPRKISKPLICEYYWFANEIYIGGAGDATLIRFGPWHRGRKPQDDHLATGIYRNGEPIKEYSTVEIEKMGSGVSSTVSHYQVFGERIGFRWLEGNVYVYEVTGVDGKVFTFDLDTGSVIEESTKQPAGGDGKAAPQP